VPRLGLEYRLPLSPDFDLPLRAGYVYEHSPVPPQTGVTNYVDTDRHVLSAGTGFVWKEPGVLVPGNVRFDLHAQYSILPTRVTLKANPADYVGDYRAKGSIFAVGANASLGFE
jgi:long-chain fatty acid transport protein